MQLDVTTNVKVEGVEFVITTFQGFLFIRQGEENVIASYNMQEVPMDIVAKDIPTKIIDCIAKPHLLLETDKDLLMFYLLLMNIINMFYIHESTSIGVENDKK